jgi:predicted Fe-S protein YdhL (DUF1289 family)
MSFDSEPDDVPSPCVNLCRLDARSGCCLGCGRTLDEIAGWSSASREEKLEILARLAPGRNGHGI